MERSNKKKYKHIDREASTNKIFALLDKIDSNNESENDNFLEDSNIEYVAEEPVSETKPDNHNILTHLKLPFLLKVPPRVVKQNYQRRNWSKKMIL